MKWGGHRGLGLHLPFRYVVDNRYCIVLSFVHSLLFCFRLQLRIFAWPDVGTDLPAGQPVKLLVGFSNTGNQDFIVESMDAAFRYPQDYSFYIQNVCIAYTSKLKSISNVYQTIVSLCDHQPHAASGVVRINPLHFLAGCRKRRLNQV